MKILPNILASAKNQKNSKFNAFKQNSKNEYRKIQKRHKRVINHPRIPPVWYPSGPLTNQVLPVHYIYVFYKRSRLPRDRYIRRRLRKLSGPSIKEGSLLENTLTTNSTDIKLGGSPKFMGLKLADFTLRKRVKPKRKYHRKRIFMKNDSLLLRRRKFRSDSTLAEQFFRPLSKAQLTSQKEFNISKFKTKPKKLGNRKKSSGSQQQNNLRIRQLRRRIQRQVIRPVWRYKPRPGGVVWPGDYLRLELVKAPKLKSETSAVATLSNGILTTSPLGSDISSAETQKTTNPQRKTRKKKRRSIQQWQLQPKKYLIQQHNLKVLKKRLQKAQNLNNLDQKLQEFYFLKNS